jgi:uncharacterized membrane protein
MPSRTKRSGPLPRVDSHSNDRAPATSHDRLTSLDAVRGVAMVIMALDHVRDFFHIGAMSFAPDDLTRTTPLLFFTRWVTHLCAPTFVFTAGVGSYLRLKRDGSKARLSWFLLTRGLWLIGIELTVMRLAMNFSFAAQYPWLLLILWAIGMSMIALALLIHLPRPLLAVVSAAGLLLHNTLDGLRPAQFGSFAPFWQMAHQPGVFLVGGMPVVVGYPVLPWIALMAAGFCAGPIFTWERERRRRVSLVAGVVLIALFVALRTVNVYGDPRPWSTQPEASLTALSFLNATKYPPSLAFLALTMGAAMVILAWLEWRPLSSRHPFVLFGRVPFFYYVVHFWVAHILAAIFAWVRYGSAARAFLFAPLPSMGGPSRLFPPDFGYSLWVAYVVWIGVVALMYPLCRWFERLKFAKRRWWTGYL